MLIKKKQIHHKFSDGLEFIPDVGRIKLLGEVFTPWPVVNKMIKDIKLNRSLSNLTVIELASGHGNFGIEILKYKFKNVLKEMINDKISDSKWTKEYEIRSLIALASLYQNDINKQNIKELKNRLHRYTINCYLKYSKNVKKEIPTYYDIAITDIIDMNCIQNNFIDDKNKKIKFIFYFRDGEYIYRVQKLFSGINITTKLLLFDNTLTFKNVDRIKFNDWLPIIDCKKYNISKNRTRKIMSKEVDKERVREREAYNKIKIDLQNKFGITNKNFKFTYCISNPPYQIQTGGKNHNIYDKFWFLATNISENVSMIFPKGWQTSTGRASGSAEHHKIREDRHIISVDNYYEDKKKNPLILFETASTGGVNIVTWNCNYDNKGLVDFYEYGKYIGKKNLLDSNKLDPKTQNIFNKLHKNYSHFMNEIITGWNPCGILTYYTSPDRKQYSNHIKFEEVTDYIKFWANDVSNNKRKWMWLPRKINNLEDYKIKINNLNEKKWKVIWPKSGAWANWRDTKIIKPKEYFSDTFICVYLDSKKQCDNFISYFKTFLYRFCESKTATSHNAVRIVHSNCVNIQNIKNPRTHKVGWDSDWTNEDLKKVFSFLTNDEWDYIQEEALKSDGGRK